MARKFSLTFIIIGIIGIISIDKLLGIFFKNNEISQQGPFALGIFFMILTGIILYFIINNMEKVVQKIDKSYKELQKKDKSRIAPYEFSLDNSVDSIHWLSLDGKFLYVNEATCRMEGYTKEEFQNMYLYDIDPNFDKESSKKCMLDIKNTENWRLESTHKRKDGTIYPVEVSGHAFIFEGKEYICAFARDITQRLEDKNNITKINQELQKSLAEKEMLLKEIHHRVKNNMEIISSLLNMQARRSDDINFKNAMKQSRSRINTMALVHEFLYLGENLAYINIQDYIKKLVQDIKELYISQNTKLDVDLDIENLIFSANRCIQVGMILHELCVNSLKYAFKENRKNLLCIHINKIDDNINIKIRDNGDNEIDITSLQKKDSIGLQLIYSIVDFQLQGKIEFKINKGLECNIMFPIKEEL
ncbi:MAG: histidine kinase dimerization/phosphoacceptor domain -containing protein [Arcobacter sp.]|jgi:PAS domain S-box-containing protein|uniref:PAS domain-containing sensor histidine kinase n=1 Tax=Arcobacter sp. TaxID=1872629 RepID=UPI002A74ECD3|nr:histidine kinase dimerization/phosphoacceptor domain -containing protein [Arcobacter sp.]MDY3205414.1 histidine kinase dimerization/phosphoacceptor domain -containing protein [Arcobacter sp.]